MRTTTLLSAALLAAMAAVSAHADDSSFGISVGAIAGLPFNDVVNGYNSSTSSYSVSTKYYTIGPEVDFRLPMRTSLEIDALYSRQDFTSSRPGVQAKTAANSWEFPALLKVEILPGPLRPFIEGGVDFRNLSGISQSQTVFSGGAPTTTTTSHPAELRRDTTPGFTYGAGISLKAGPVRLTPEVRLVHWDTDNWESSNSLLRTNRNTASFLLSFTF